MTRRILWVTMLAALALAGLTGCENPATGKPEAEVKEQAGTSGGMQAEGTRFVITDGSTIGFVGSKVTGSHTGGFNEFDGEIVLVGGDPSKSRVEVTIDTTSMWTDNDRLTGHLKSPDFFEVENFPSAKFVSTGIMQEGDNFMISGDLSLRGVTKNVTFPATITVAEGGVQASAEFVIQRFDFGIEYPGKPDDLIRDEVVVKLDLSAAPESAA